MSLLPDSIRDLIEALGRLPGVGPKSAERLAFFLLKRGRSENQILAETIEHVHDGVHYCERCFMFSSEALCKVCQDTQRDEQVLCVVESPMDLIALEKTGEFKGRYHVLHGKLSPLDGIGVEDLKLAELMQRIAAPNALFEELILALNPDLEGDATALYIQKQLESCGRHFNVTRLARGIPSGGHLEYTDEATLIRALQGRQRIS